MLSWVEVDAGAIRWNIEQFRGFLAPTSQFAAVIKSNAYGHGLLEVAAAVRDTGVNWLCVNNIDEARRLRQAGHLARIITLGYVPLDRLEQVVQYDIRPVVYNRETIEKLDRLARAAGKQVPVHLKLETGTFRQGVSEDQVSEVAARIDAAEGLILEGISTHFANIEDTTDHSYAESQMKRFETALERLKAAGIEPALRHAACSAATLLFTRTHLDLARVGISLYGIWPSRETFVSCRERGKTPPELRPALTWKTRVVQVKQVRAGSFIGYGCTYRTNRDSRVAVLPIGYYEGYPRGLSGVAHVLIRGSRAPLIGRVCMNLCMVDVTDIPEIQLEDEVVLLGRQADERISAEQLAGWLGTIAYEVLARIHPDLPRVVVDASPVGR